MKKEQALVKASIEDAVLGIINGEGSKSNKMKELFGLGMQVKEIAELMGVRYNFALVF